MPTRKMLLALLVCAAVGATSWTAQAQTYPARPITVIVPFPAGGPTDTIARILGAHMQTSLGQPIVIENVPGASGSIGVGRVARAAPDGYTLSFGTWSTHVVNGATLTLHYDVVKDFEPVALVAHSPMVLVAKKTIAANNVMEFVAWLKANPGKALQGTPGNASASHLAGLLFQDLTATRFQFVPYHGVGPAMQDLLAERIDFIFDLAANSLPHIRAGSVRALAALSEERLSSLPDVSTADEAGVPDLHVSSWQAIWAPKSTPKHSIAILNRAVTEALMDSSVRQRLFDLAQEIPPSKFQTPEALGTLQKSEIGKWWPIIKVAGIKQE